MTQFLKTFLNARSLKAATKELSIEQLEEVAAKLALIIEKKKEEEDAKTQAAIEVKKKLAEYKEMMENEGIDPKQFMELFNESTPKDKRTPRPAKYQYDDNGNTKTWTGQGRQPSIISNAINNGAVLEDFLIR